MPSIRFPASAASLLPLCKGHGDPDVFKTYADLIAFLVAFGFKQYSEHGQPLPVKPAFLSIPNAVPLEVFENRKHDTNFIMICLAYDSSRQIAENDDQLCNLMERLAYLGGNLLSLELKDEELSIRLKMLSSLLANTSTSTDEIRI